MPILAYLGPEGTFSSYAARQYAGKMSPGPLNLRSYPTIMAIFEALAAGEAEFGLVPIENSIEGSVPVTLDLLAENHSINIQGEMCLPIVHNLLTRAASFAEITKVYSHPQALAQCRTFLAKNLNQADLVPTNSTAEAAWLISQGDTHLAAIGPRECASYYRLPVLAADIADYSNNETRFLLLGKEKNPSPSCAKTSLVLELKEDRPGGLYEVLGLFAREKINLCRIESRPNKSALGKYRFFIDCEAGAAHPGLQRVLAELSSITASYRNLGSYSSLG